MFRRRAIIGSVPAPVEQRIIYGVKLDRTMDSDQPLGEHWATYTDNAVGLSEAYMDFTNDVFVDNGWYNRWPFNQIRPCIVNNGAVVGYLKKDNYAQYEDGTTAPITDRTAGNVMVEIPIIYYKVSADSQYNYIQISNQMFDGACCLSHTYKGQELSKIYVDAYLSGGSDYETYGPYSISGSNPGPEYFTMSYSDVYPTIKTFRGNRCEPLNYNIHTLIDCLFAIMFKTTNCRISLGKGLYGATENGVETGVLDNKGFCYGEDTNSRGDNVLGRIKLFGLEDYYGAKYTFCAGLYVDANKNYRIINPYDTTLEYSPNDATSFPINNPETTDLMPFPESSSLIPVKITGENTLGFARTNQNTSANDVSTDSNVGFCSKTKYSSTGNYTIGLIATSFKNDAGVYAFQTFTKDATNRRAFRIVYFPEESNSQEEFVISGTTLMKYNGNSTSVTIPSNVTAIGSGAFVNNTNIISVSIPNSVTRIYDSAFMGCTSLTTINIPSSITEIGNNVFYNCSSLTGITLPSGLTKIWHRAFAGCSSITSITIPDNVTFIGVQAFKDCTSLTTISVPSGVSSINIELFSGCSGLNSITINATTPPTLTNTNAFDNTNSCPIYVPSASVTDYQNETNWSSLSSRIQANPV